MEVWKGLSYESIMSIPTTRRQRLVGQKIQLEQRRQAEHRQQMSRTRSGRR